MTDKEIIMEVLKRMPVCSEGTIHKASRNAETKERVLYLADKYFDENTSRIIILTLAAEMVRKCMPFLSFIDRQRGGKGI